MLSGKLNSPEETPMSRNHQPAVNDKQQPKQRLTAAQKVAATAGAIAVLAPASDTNAEIVYQDSAPVSANLFDGNGASFDWDVDGDGPAEFALRIRSSRFGYSSYFSSNSFFNSNVFYGIVNFASRRTSGQQLNGQGLVGQGGISAFNLNQGFRVGPTLAGYQWGASDQSYRAALRFDSASFQVPSGTFLYNPGSQVGSDFYNFSLFDTGFIGFRFDIAGSQHYGWAELNFNGDQLTITRWAYESVAGRSIDVGAIPEPSSLGLLGLGAAGVLAMRRRRKTEPMK